MAKKNKEEEIDEDFIIASMNMTGPSGSNKVQPPVNTEEETVEVHQQQIQTGIIPKEEAASGVSQLEIDEDKTIQKESRRKKSKGEYETAFIRQADITGRQEKTTYLREKYYNRIMKILLLYGNPRLSVFAYVDAVLEHHFEFYRQDIMEIYNKKNNAPY